MTSSCISNCINDARDARVPVRATYVNLYKWPESDAAFVRSVSSNREKGEKLYGHHDHPRVVDSISCRQLYLRSYTFSREDEKVKVKKTHKCFGKVKKENGNKFLVWRKAKEFSCSALFSIFQRFLFCCASVDVADDKYYSS